MLDKLLVVITVKTFLALGGRRGRGKLRQGVRVGHNATRAIEEAAVVEPVDPRQQLATYFRRHPLGFSRGRRASQTGPGSPGPGRRRTPARKIRAARPAWVTCAPAASRARAEHASAARRAQAAPPPA